MKPIEQLCLQINVNNYTALYRNVTSKKHDERFSGSLRCVGWRSRQLCSLKRWYPTTTLHGAKIKETTISVRFRLN